GYQRSSTAALEKSSSPTCDAEAPNVVAGPSFRSYSTLNHLMTTPSGLADRTWSNWTAGGGAAVCARAAPGMSRTSRMAAVVWRISSLSPDNAQTASELAHERRFPTTTTAG